MRSVTLTQANAHLQALLETETMNPTITVAIKGDELHGSEARKIFKRYPGFYSYTTYRNSLFRISACMILTTSHFPDDCFLGRFRTLYAAEQAFASLQNNPPTDDFTVRYQASIPCSTVAVRFSMLGPVEPIAQIIEEHAREAFKFYLRQSCSFIVFAPSFPLTLFHRSFKYHYQSGLPFRRNSSQIPPGHSKRTFYPSCRIGKVFGHPRHCGAGSENERLDDWMYHIPCHLQYH